MKKYGEVLASGWIFDSGRMNWQSVIVHQGTPNNSDSLDTIKVYVIRADEPRRKKP